MGSSESVSAWDVVGQDTLQQNSTTDRVQGRTHSYSLDRVYGPDSTTRCLYEQSVKPLVMSAMEGFHASVFAYGQTSTGKTFTMTGSPTQPGVVPLAVRDCFRFVEKLETDREYLFRVSYLEIYNEQIIDLLTDTSSAVRIFESPKEGVVIRGLREEVVTCPEDVFEWIQEGETKRQVGSTNMNKHSSRSHAVFRLWIESKSHGSMVRVSTLSLVDLAGSESARLTGASGDRMKEGQYINKSLMALGQVVYKLSELHKRQETGANLGGSGGTGPHIPYRDSKLTRLLQPSLSGNAQICIICNISPLSTHLEESHNTLKFAMRAKKIQQRASVTEVTDEKTLLQSYREQIDELNKQLEVARAAAAAAAQGQQQQQQQQQHHPEVSDDDIQDIKEAIAQMERLILKTNSLNRKRGIDDDLLVAASTENPEDFLRMQPVDDDDIGMTTEATDDNLVDEMHRIQGLLDGVLSKRLGGSLSSISSDLGVKAPPTSSTSSSAPATASDRDAEVQQLRAQLLEKEAATSLRKADASFLQRQLTEKDNLLAEVSKILEAVENRQVELEEENYRLKAALRTTREDNDALRLQVAQLEARSDAVVSRSFIGDFRRDYFR